MSQNVFTSASPPGAGRLVDVWLDIPTMVLLGGALGSNPGPYALTRIGGSPVKDPTGSAFTKVDPDNLMLSAVHGGRPVMQMPTGGAACSYRCNYVIQPQAFAATGNRVDSDALNNWRIVIVAAASNFGAVGSPDIGFFIRGFPPVGVTQTGGAGGNWPGFGVIWADAFGIPYWISRSNTIPSPPDEQIPIPGAVADGDFHSYEFRMQWATDTTNATIDLLYDDVTVITRAWNPVSVLPSYTTWPGMGSLDVLVQNPQFSCVGNLWLNQFRVIAAPTFQSLF